METNFALLSLCCPCSSLSTEQDSLVSSLWHSPFFLSVVMLRAKLCSGNLSHTVGRTEARQKPLFSEMVQTFSPACAVPGRTYVALEQTWVHSDMSIWLPGRLSIRVAWGLEGEDISVLFPNLFLIYIQMSSLVGGLWWEEVRCSQVKSTGTKAGPWIIWQRGLHPIGPYVM